MKFEVYIPYAVVFEDGKPVRGYADGEMLMNWDEGNVWDIDAQEWRTASDEELQQAHDWVK
jgi:hypothetical protein